MHVNLTRGLDGRGMPGAHVMKLNYTSLQHAVIPAEGRELQIPLGRPVGVFQLHGQLAPVAWALAQARGGLRVGYVQTAGGALPGGMSDTVRQLLEPRPARRPHDRRAGLRRRRRRRSRPPARSTTGSPTEGWDVALVGPGPGILGSGSALGHGGIVALDSAHAALALGCPTVLTARMSSGDPRERHRGLSHHTRTVLELLLRPVTLPVPPGARVFAELDGIGPALDAARAAGHEVVEAPIDVDGYRASGLPTRTMGRTFDEDRLFFAAALAAGGALAELTRAGAGMSRVRAGRQRGRSGPATSARCRVERYRHADGEVVTRENVAHPGAVAIVPCDETHVWLIRQPREICGRAGAAGDPRRQARRRGRGRRARPPSASWPRRSARRPTTWEHLKAIYTSPGFTDERIDIFLATGLRDVAAPAGRGGRADRDRRRGRWRASTTRSPSAATRSR